MEIVAIITQYWVKKCPGIPISGLVERISVERIEIFLEKRCHLIGGGVTTGHASRVGSGTSFPHVLSRSFKSAHSGESLFPNICA